MKEMDLELFRWDWYKLRIRDIKANRDAALGLRAFWSEYGVFVSTLPRQAGKTEMIIRMATDLQNDGERFIIIVPNTALRHHFLNRAPHIAPDKVKTNPGAMVSAYQFYRPEDFIDTHLLIDEYELIHDQAMSRIFTEDWKSISLVGSMTLRII